MARPKALIARAGVADLKARRSKYSRAKSRSRA